MTLYEVAFACWVFGNVLDFDKSYERFLKAVDRTPDLNNREHRQALLEWLNDWGCRQFACKDHCQAGSELLSWHNEFGSVLPAAEKHLWQLDDAEVTQAVHAYADLALRVASLRAGKSRVRFGPVGAAKILFALRPRAFPPWDRPIQKELRYDGSPQSYRHYLEHVIGLLRHLSAACQRHGFQLADFPLRLERHLSTPVKLIDEYYWVTVTGGCKLPAPETVKQWLEWTGPRLGTHMLSAL